MRISQNTREYKMTWGSRWFISQWKRFCSHQIDTVIRFLSSYVRYSTGWDFISAAFLSYAVILVMSKCIHVTLTQLYARRMLYKGQYYHRLLAVFEVCWRFLQQVCFTINMLSARGYKVLLDFGETFGTKPLSQWQNGELADDGKGKNW